MKGRSLSESLDQASIPHKKGAASPETAPVGYVYVKVG